MVEVILKEIDKSNWQDCLNLKLSTSQGGLVSPHLFSFADTSAEPYYMQMAIYGKNDEVVGFIMYGYEENEGEYWVFRLLIDEKHQGRGYGKAALIDVLNRMKKIPECQAVYLGYKPQNVVAASMFAGLGFRKTGQMLQGEFIAKIDMEDWPGDGSIGLQPAKE